MGRKAIINSFEKDKVVLVEKDKMTLLEKDKNSEIEDLIKRDKVLSAAVKADPFLTNSLLKAAQAMADAFKIVGKSFAQMAADSLIKTDEKIAKAAKISGFREAFIKFLQAVIDRKLATKPATSQPTPGVSTEPADDEPDEEELIEVDDSADDISVRLLALLNDIPIAHHGDIITSEHHNSLRRAIRAIATLIDDTDSTSIHTFGPTFLPAVFPQPETQSDHRWKLLYNKAVVPSLEEMGGAHGYVSGGLLARLPDDVLIKGMIVRGKRLDEDAQDPKALNITLLQVEPDKAHPLWTPIIIADLKDATGTFKRLEKTTSSVRVDNTKYHYYVIAVWEDEDDSSGFEIRSVQIICER